MENPLFIQSNKAEDRRLLQQSHATILRLLAKAARDPNIAKEVREHAGTMLHLFCTGQMRLSLHAQENIESVARAIDSAANRLNFPFRTPPKDKHD